MAEITPSLYVAIDTSSYEKGAFNFEWTVLRRLVPLLKEHHVQLYISDIVRREVESHIATKVAASVARHNKSLESSDMRLIRHLSPGGMKLFEPLDPQEFIERAMRAFKAFLRQNGAIEVTTGTIDATPVLRAYFEARPPFGSSSDKRYEFPDAIQLVALDRFAATHGVDITVVTEDKGMVDACADFENLKAAYEIKTFLESLATNDAALAAFIRHNVVARHRELEPLISESFKKLSFHVSDVDGDVTEILVTGVHVYDPIITSVSDDRDPGAADVLMSASINYEVELEYQDYSEAMWDSEEKEWLFARTVTDTTSSTFETSALARVTFRGLDPDSVSFEAAGITEPSLVYVNVRTDSEVLD